MNQGFRLSFFLAASTIMVVSSASADINKITLSESNISDFTDFSARSGAGLSTACTSGSEGGIAVTRKLELVAGGPR